MNRKLVFMQVAFLACCLNVFTTFAQDPVSEEGMPIRDPEGNVYRVIMTQNGVWLADNLNSFSLNDGTPIKLIRNKDEWENTKVPAYGWFSDDLNYCMTYGPIYNYYAVATGKLCPKGWHVPTETEWNDLMDYAGGNQKSGSNPAKLKEKGTTHWKSPNTGATNEVLFNALPAGYINFFSDPPEAGTKTIWWTSTEDSTSIDETTGKASNANIIGVSYNFNSKTMGTFLKEFALPVRCKLDD